MRVTHAARRRHNIISGKHCLLTLLFAWGRTARTKGTAWEKTQRTRKHTYSLHAVAH